MLARTRSLAAALLAAGALASVAPSASADTGVTTIPLPTFTVTAQCGPLNDVITVDPAWQKAWGDKVDLFANSLTFQGGKDGGRAKPAAMIRTKYRSSYVWAGASATGWDRFWLFPGTVTPIVDANTACPVQVPTPQIEQIAVRGPHNDAFVLASGNESAFWDIVSVDWQGQRATVTVRAKDGYVGPDGSATFTREFTDQVNVG